MQAMEPIARKPREVQGFTLVELLVVLGIIVVLAALSSMGASRFIESGRKVQTLAQFRDFQAGNKGFIELRRAVIL